jgi:hypothetical protein
MREGKVKRQELVAGCLAEKNLGEKNKSSEVMLGPFVSASSSR